MGTDICFPLAKYSCATGVLERNVIPWTHVMSSKLFIIVKGSDRKIRDEQLILRIVQANDVLESLDIGRYVDEARQVLQKAESEGTSLVAEQLSIFGMTKEVLLALRYTLDDGQPRRLQMRLHSAAECRQIIHVFEARGMEFKPQRPETGRPDTARPLTVGSRVATPHSSSPHFAAPPSSNRPAFIPQVLEAGSLSLQRPVSLQRADHEMNAASRSSTLRAEEIPSSKLFSRDETFAPREVAPSRPSTAQIYRSYTTPSQANRFDEDDIVHQAERSGLARPSSTSNTAGAEALDKALEQYHSPPRSALITFPSEVQPGSADGFTPSSDTVEHADTLLSATSNTRAAPTRPSMSSLVFAETLEHEIPPRRELPFTRPDSRCSDKSESRPRSALALPPLPRPKLSPQNESASSTMGMKPPVRPASSARPQTSSPLKRSYGDMNQDSAGIQRPSTASPTKKIAPARKASPEPPARHLSGMDELLYGRKASLEKASGVNVQRTNSLADAPHEIEDPPPGKSASPKRQNFRYDSMSPVRQANRQRDHTVGAYAAIAAPEGQPRDGGLERYASMSLQDRQAALDEFMVQNLENPAFTVLCEDVENCWKRIALGL